MWFLNNKKNNRQNSVTHTVKHPAATSKITGSVDNNIPSDDKTNIRNVLSLEIINLKSAYDKITGDNNYLNQELSTFTIVRHLWPKADSRVCPYCGTIFDKPVKRARRCPECNSHVNVRGGLVITDDQLNKMLLWQDRNQRVKMLANDIKSADSSFTYDQYIESAATISQGYRRIGAYDRSWRILTNSSVVQFAALLDSLYHWEATRQIFFARCYHGEDELKYSSEDRKGKKASLLAWIYILFLIEVINSGNNMDSWDIEHVALQLNTVTETYKLDLDEILNRSLDRPDISDKDHMKSEILNILHKNLRSFV